ncbi:hypothetical protein A1O1_01171 [Capronia coronata CBS 617.96]|uniref:Kinetochore protein Mis13/DSN1 n=1 Tax=Capronia coronata CBS 617.96 TaxID=1182541 RepID=W9Z268_9EURO|nr:uncharacterized protein A1O1_01171 [Capronia coronata CBS 617.96]EXJ96045.1 hypothetical protein A1O1_01171 [Capronia coronata CBS 617.96]
MSSTQRPNRRLSARLQVKGDAPGVATRPSVNGIVDAQGSTQDARRAQTSKSFNEKKRKMTYDEEDDGFLFKRVKQKEQETTKIQQPRSSVPPQVNTLKPPETTERSKAPEEEVESPSEPKKRRKRLSFSTPKPKEGAPMRRSKRLSRDNEQKDGSPAEKVPRDDKHKRRRQHPDEHPPETTETVDEKESSHQPEPVNKLENGNIEEGDTKENVPTHREDHSATKIALPFADTPVIKRNKAMREGKVGKNERRSSLGLRGRRASSLIETGNSNALPHKEVEISDFYKHIESEGLPEPRRMRQLLTWCATRALDEKPMGTDFEDASAPAAARVVEEELLKELSNKSELSDWFNREDVPVPKRPLPERPNPKNLQNIEKIAELEEQIKRLRAEKDAMESLLQPPQIPRLSELDTPTSLGGGLPDRTLLSDADVAALEVSAAADTTSFDQISSRLNRLYQSVGPTIDTFADGVHAIGQYRQSADNVAGRVLSMCAQKLAQREHDGRKRALPAAQGTPPKDLGGVLRSLSRADR